MDKDTIIELRERIRKHMQENDYCIGEDKLEEFFRQTLGEPEPVNEYTSTGPALTMEQFSRLLQAHIGEHKKFLERDDTFYDQIKKK